MQEPTFKASKIIEMIAELLRPPSMHEILQNGNRSVGQDHYAD